MTVTTSRAMQVFVDANNVGIATVVPQYVLVPLTLMILSAIALGRGWGTPGKRLAGLQITGTGCAMCRELRRMGVFVMLGCGQVFLNSAPQSFSQMPAWAVSSGAVALVVLGLIYYIWPLLVWRGAMPYDRATGFEVVRAA